MWRLFPKSWFPTQDPATSAKAITADQFAAKWREYLVTALSEICGRDNLNFEQAIALLPLLDTKKLLSFDLKMRHGWRFSSDFPIRGQRVSVTPLEDPTEGAAHLFTASCHGNGFIRERALQAFEHYPGRLALVAALIRCDDWVPAVQKAALALLTRLIASESAELLFAHLSLLLRLQQRQRASECVWPDHIEPALRSARFREARWRGTQSAEADARAFAFQLVLEADPDRSEDVLRAACSDLHPRVALWGLAHIHAYLVGPGGLELLRLAMRHKNAAVRADAVRRYAAIESDDLRVELERAIFDSSRGPRDAAAYWLDRLFQVSAPQSWREVIDSRDAGRLNISITALSYVAEPLDAERLTPFLIHSSARIRAVALRGLVRATSMGADKWLRQALSDSSGLVVRCAISLLARDGQLLGRAELETAHGEAANDRVRRQLIRAARLLGKWDALLFLIPQLSSVDAGVAGEEINRWLRAANRRFTALDAATRTSIKGQLAEIAPNRRDRQWQRLDEVLRQS